MLSTFKQKLYALLNSLASGQVKLKMTQHGPKNGAPHPRRVTSLVIDGNVDGGISIVLGVIITVFNIAEIVVLGKKGGNRKKAEHIILSLSCADFLVGIAYTAFGILKIIYKYNPNSTTVEDATKQTRMVLAFTIIASVLHLLVISVERLYAVHRPLQYRRIVTNKRMLIIIICIWICSGTLLALVYVAGIKGLSGGELQSWLIFVTSAIMVFVYGYLAYFLFTRCQKNLSAANMHEQSKTKLYSDQKRDTIFCIGIATAFILCSLLAAIGWQLPKQMSTTTNWVNSIAEFLLAFNSVLNPILYFWKSHLSRKGEMPSQPLQVIKWALQAESRSRPGTPPTASTPLSTPLQVRKNPPKTLLEQSNESLSTSGKQD